MAFYIDLKYKNPQSEDCGIFSFNKSPSGGAPQPLVGAELHPKA